MKLKTLSLIYSAVFVLLILPSIVVAQIDSPFYVETTAEYDNGDIFDDDPNDDSSDALPLESWSEILSEAEDNYAEAGALIDFSEEGGLDVAVHAFADNFIDDPLTYSRGYAYASIYDTFTATDPVLRFSYNFEYWIEVEGYTDSANAYNEVSATLTVYDSAYENPIYDNMFIYSRVEVNGEEGDDDYNQGEGWFDVNVTTGHEIRALLELRETAYAAGDAFAGHEGGGDPESLYLTVDVESMPAVPVVPEPISSTLFIVGGALLGFRRWRNKKTVR